MDIPSKIVSGNTTTQYQRSDDGTLLEFGLTYTVADLQKIIPRFNALVAELADITASTANLNKTAIATALYSLGTPILADVDRIVTSANMKVGEYTIAAQPDVPRNITVTVTAGDTADTMGTVTVTGTNRDDDVISEVITPEAGATVAGTKAFKTVTKVEGADWVIDGSEGTNDTITVGVGDELGLPVALSATSQMKFACADTAWVDVSGSVAETPTVEETTIDMSAATYDGSKEMRVFVSG